MGWGKGIFAHGMTNSRGVCILINKNAAVEIERFEVNLEGHIVVCDLRMNEFRFRLVNIYAPNNDSPEFFGRVEHKCHNKFDHIIIVGDFNVVMDVELDQNSTTHNNYKSEEKIKSLMDEYLLDEVWRNRNPKVCRFSWHRFEKGKKVQASQIDYGLVSRGLRPAIRECMYMAGLNTNHSAFYIYMENSKNERGPGFWKFNTLLLRDPDYLKMMNEFIDKFVDTHESMENFCKWELFKFEVATQTPEFAKAKVSDREMLISQLSEKVVELEQALAKDVQNCELGKILHDTKIDLDKQMNDKIKGVIFRTRARWQDLAEKSSKYFYALEKANYNMKFSEENEMNELVTNPVKILALQKEFYQKLYKKDCNVAFEIENIEGVTISQEEKTSMEQNFTFDEFATALKQMKNSKCSGLNGIPCDFYKVFFAKVGKLLFKVIVEGLELGHLWDTALKGIINLIPKPRKDIRWLKKLKTYYAPQYGLQDNRKDTCESHKTMSG